MQHSQIGGEGIIHERDEAGHGRTAQEWDVLRDTIGSVSAVKPHDIGRDGAEVRKRAKREA
jgi:hypothetical protein